MHDLALRAGALVVFLAIVGGGFYAADAAFGRDAGEARGGLRLEPVEAAKLGAPGDRVTFPVVVRNGLAEAVDVQLRGGHPAPDHVALGPGEARGVFVTVEVPAAAAQAPQRVLLEALVDGRVAASQAVTVGTAKGTPAREGDEARVDYVGRFANGTLFDTSVAAVGAGPFAKPAGFSRQYQPLQVQLAEGAGTIEGFWQGIVGLAEGQSRTVTLAPEQAYGNATQRLEVPRELEVPRRSQPYERVQTFPRTLLQQHLNESSAPGDTIRVRDPGGNDRTYLVVDLDAVNATIAWQVREGDVFTVYAVWPNQSRAVDVTDTQVTFLTTPADAHGTLTWFSFWPGASRVKAVDDEVIVLEHNPVEGLTFALPRRGAGQATVADVGPEVIVVEAPNDHPLAGQTLVFDVTVRGVQRAH